MIDKKILCNDVIIAKKVVYCDSFLRKATGLILRSKNSVKDTVWWFTFRKPRKVSITMFLVFFPIDLIFLDEHNKIVEIEQGLKPFGYYTCRKNISSFIELEHGIVKKKFLKIGMRLSTK